MYHHSIRLEFSRQKSGLGYQNDCFEILCLYCISYYSQQVIVGQHLRELLLFILQHLSIDTTLQ